MKRSSNIVGLIGTILIHLMIILPIIIHFTPITTPPPNPPVIEEPKNVSVTLIPPPAPITNKKVTNDDSERLLFPVDKKICDNKDSTYIGVGIIVSFGSSIVTYAPEYYPAYKAGMRVGDFLVNSDESIINGWVDYDVVRDMKQLHFHIKAGSICFGPG